MDKNLYFNSEQNKFELLTKEELDCNDKYIRLKINPNLILNIKGFTEHVFITENAKRFSIKYSETNFILIDFNISDSSFAICFCDNKYTEQKFFDKVTYIDELIEFVSKVTFVEFYQKIDIMNDNISYFLYKQENSNGIQNNCN